MENLYLDLHILQTVPPSCINRDDTGSPKSAFYGGVTRARISSQSWKHAMRRNFNELLNESECGMRTKKIVDMVAKYITKCTGDEAREEAADALEMALNSKYKKGDAKAKRSTIKDLDKGTDALFFMSEAQAKALADLANAGITENKQYKDALASAPSVDMALFGRMVAADPSLNFDAAAQVAHAISTHAVQSEFDYFTAVDDCSAKDNAGAGHLGTVAFNSSTLYRYATVNVRILREELGQELLLKAIRAFVESFATTMPTGKQNTFANRTLPNCIYAALRRDQPVNLVSAFEKPVTSKDGGYVEESVRKLAAYLKETENFVKAPINAWGVGTPAQHLVDKTCTLQDMLDGIAAELS